MRYTNRHILNRPPQWVPPKACRAILCPGCGECSHGKKFIAGLCRRCFRRGAAYPEGTP